MVKQRTLKNIVHITGIGLHTGKNVNLTLRSAPANAGVIFRRVDFNPPIEFPADIKYVRDTTLSTCLINDNGVRISTIEHVNAALAGLGIDNIIIEVNAPEIPILDGSADTFIYLFKKSGIQELNIAKKFIRIIKTVRVSEGDKWAEIKPHSGFFIDFTIDFDHPLIQPNVQRYKINFSSESFINQISRARTFGFMNEIKELQNRGFCLGGSLKCAIVIDTFNILNAEGLRFKDELVRHKILDAIGDLFVCGHNIIGAFSAYKSGHTLNNKLLKTLLSSTESWELVTFNDDVELPVNFTLSNFIN